MYQSHFLSLAHTLTTLLRDHFSLECDLSKLKYIGFSTRKSIITLCRAQCNPTPGSQLHDMVLDHIDLILELGLGPIFSNAILSSLLIPIVIAAPFSIEEVSQIRTKYVNKELVRTESTVITSRSPPSFVSSNQVY